MCVWVFPNCVGGREHLSEVTVELRPNHEKELITQNVERRIFQREGTASTKALK